MLLWAALPALAAPPLPQRNLVVEMRVIDNSQATQQLGQVTWGSSTRGEASGGATVRAGTQQQGSDTLQRVLVLNGARATLRVAQGVLVDDTEVAWTPWGPAAAVRSQWVELVNGIEVAPRWPGGNAPVTVELSAQRAPSVGQAQAARQAAVPTQWTVLSTVQAPLGEWLDVAQIGERREIVSSGFGAATASRQRHLQLRVSLP